MAQGLEIDLKEIVLSNSTFGPNEIDQLTRAISGDASRVPVLRDSVGDARHGGAVGCLLLPVGTHHAGD
jgi:hypothetical protein